MLTRRRKALEVSRFQSVLDSGAKVFVRPEIYTATMEEIRAKGLRLFSSHVVVEEELADDVVSLVGGIHQGIYPHGTETVSVPAPISVDRTFINIKVPSSLRSSTDVRPRSD